MTFIPLPPDLLDDLREIINRGRAGMAGAFRQGIVLTYWHVGACIRWNILGNERADYGQEIVATVSQELTAEFGRGYSPSAIHRMVEFAERFSDPGIVATLSREVSWGHFVLLLPLQNSLKRDFYVETSRRERWDVRTTRDRIEGMLFERTAISKKLEELILKELADLRDQERYTPDLVFRDPYLLDFLGRLKNDVLEHSLHLKVFASSRSAVLANSR